MADTDLSAASPAPAHPMAKTGYGKRTAGDPSGDQLPSTAVDFAHLPVREAYLAHFVERLPEGASMDVKTLAQHQPLYGQQAVRSALRRLSEEGHLRRVSASVGLDGGAQWVTRTYFSPVARGAGWWAAFLAGRLVGGDPSVADAAAPNEPRTPAGSRQPAPRQQRPPKPHAATSDAPRAPHRSTAAYQALAELGRHDPRLVLSAAECAELAGLAAQWLERGVDRMRFTHAMTQGLPQPLYSPAGVLRSRLRKLPPEPPNQPESAAGSRSPRWLLECTDCGVPGESTALPGGLCRRCRSASTEPSDSGPPQHPAPGLPEAEVRRRAAELRQTMRAAAGPEAVERERGGGPAALARARSARPQEGKHP